jgi:phosphopantetheinyl transferase
MIRIYGRFTDSKKQSDLHNEVWQLLYFVLSRDYGYEKDKLTVFKNSAGKPYFSDCPHHFSLCHTDGLLLVAVSDFPVGIDAERSDRVITGAVSKRFFSKENATISDWTEYESVGKMLGCGIPYNREEFGAHCFIRHCIQLAAYSICCACSGEMPPEIIEII